eukprot:CAMPEP_0113820860 /NCGR_PEP_ID=MMETSP0328-20130328/1450_1 /TAXON_ID=39455 /ORGANISM="Alexandrium minutum" /LENGTH=141 /DNA_ID=CAMNT_0000788793 /DNA_START=69 /DNA_END=496 /DNA_ORIENTATION=+ /assembly_acc=CAM_ASM_000350
MPTNAAAQESMAALAALGMAQSMLLGGSGQYGVHDHGDDLDEEDPQSRGHVREVQDRHHRPHLPSLHLCRPEVRGHVGHDLCMRLQLQPSEQVHVDRGAHGVVHELVHYTFAPRVRRLAGSQFLKAAVNAKYQKCKDGLQK